MTDRRILIVAHRTAASPKLLAAVAERAARGPCMFTLLVPRPYFDPDTEEAAITLELAIPLLDATAGSHVQGIVGATDPYEAVRQTLEREKYDEVIVSTLPERVSRWLRLDLAHRIERFGVPRERGYCEAGRAHTLAGSRGRLIDAERRSERRPPRFGSADARRISALSLHCSTAALGLAILNLERRQWVGRAGRSCRDERPQPVVPAVRPAISNVGIWPERAH